jgi:hypothetical protein
MSYDCGVSGQPSTRGRGRYRSERQRAEERAPGRPDGRTASGLPAVARSAGARATRAPARAVEAGASTRGGSGRKHARWRRAPARAVEAGASTRGRFVPADRRRMNECHVRPQPPAGGGRAIRPQAGTAGTAASASERRSPRRDGRGGKRATRRRHKRTSARQAGAARAVEAGAARAPKRAPARALPKRVGGSRHRASASERGARAGETPKAPASEAPAWETPWQTKDPADRNPRGLRRAQLQLSCPGYRCRRRRSR